MLIADRFKQRFMLLFFLSIHIHNVLMLMTIDTIQHFSDILPSPLFIAIIIIIECMFCIFNLDITARASIVVDKLHRINRVLQRFELVFVCAHQHIIKLIPTQKRVQFVLYCALLLFFLLFAVLFRHFYAMQMQHRQRGVIIELDLSLMQHLSILVSALRKTNESHELHAIADADEDGVHIIANRVVRVWRILVRRKHHVQHHTQRAHHKIQAVQPCTPIWAPFLRQYLHRHFATKHEGDNALDNDTHFAISAIRQFPNEHKRVQYNEHEVDDKKLHRLLNTPRSRFEPFVTSVGGVNVEQDSVRLRVHMMRMVFM
mmetsp:Transcript_59598/g.98345  ORF Transcript_59598/g.98345 Transcript_59598/m.98345 type:complete len:316 (+) Transcript_59598:334-1281(+)